MDSPRSKRCESESISARQWCRVYLCTRPAAPIPVKIIPTNVFWDTVYMTLLMLLKMAPSINFVTHKRQSQCCKKHPNQFGVKHWINQMDSKSKYETSPQHRRIQAPVWRSPSSLLDLEVKVKYTHSCDHDVAALHNYSAEGITAFLPIMSTF